MIVELINKFFKEETSKPPQDDQENRRIGKRMFKLKESSITRIDHLDKENDSYLTSKYGKRMNQARNQSIYGSQFLME